MIIKSSANQVSFLFQEEDHNCEIGYKLLEQYNIKEMMEFKRSITDGRDRLQFDFDEKRIVPVSVAAEKMNDNEIVDLLYRLIYVIVELERGGVLGRKCICYRDGLIYYDTEARLPKVIIIPTLDEVGYGDDMSWEERFADAMLRLSNLLSRNKRKRFEAAVTDFKSCVFDIDGLLEAVDGIGSGKSGLLINKPQKTVKKTLQLLYSGSRGRFEFKIYDKDFIIGKNPGIVDGVVSVSEAVSRRHCLITKINNTFFVQDLDSVNHTFVNNTVVPPFELMELADRDILGVADVDFRVRLIRSSE